MFCCSSVGALDGEMIAEYKEGMLLYYCQYIFVIVLLSADLFEGFDENEVTHGVQPKTSAHIIKPSGQELTTEEYVKGTTWVFDSDSHPDLVYRYIANQNSNIVLGLIFDWLIGSKQY